MPIVDISQTFRTATISGDPSVYMDSYSIISLLEKIEIANRCANETYAADQIAGAIRIIKEAAEDAKSKVNN